jgi:hypothetical protein
MHQADILDEVRERVTRNRGGVAVFNSLIPHQTAHIVVDLQNGFMDHGQVAETPMARTIVPNVNRISAALRAAGGLWSIHSTRRMRRRSAHGRSFLSISADLKRRARFIEGVHTWQPRARPLVGARRGRWLAH